MPRQPRSFKLTSASQIQALEAATTAFHHASREPGTHDNRNRFIRYYVELCESRKMDAFPADPFDVACFLVKYCVDLKSVASLKDALSAICTELRERCALEWTRAEEWYLKRVKRGLCKQFRLGVKRKCPITQEVLLQVLRQCDLANLDELQQATASFVAQNCCLRLKEALQLRWSDVAWEDTDELGLPRVVALTIRVSKARYEEEPETIRVPRFQLDGVPACAVQMFWLYMKDARALQRQAGNQEAFLFPRFQSPSAGAARTKHKALKRKTAPAEEGGDDDMESAAPCKRDDPNVMVRSSFLEWLSRKLTAADLVASEFSGHSFRASGATDLHSGKVPEHIGMMLGRWRCRDAYLLYLRLSPSEQAVVIAAAYEEAWHQRSARRKVR